MRAVAIIQARMGSTRLPGKVMLDLCGHPILWHVIERVRATSGVEAVAVATSLDPGNDPIRALCEDVGVRVFSGSEEDVLDRYYRAAQELGADPVVRVTSDCPLFDPGVNERMLEMFAEGNYEHVAVATGGGAEAAGVMGYPTGLGGECFTFAALERAWREATEQSDREHVTPYIWRRREEFRCGWLAAPHDWHMLRLTVDEPEDYQLVQAIYDGLYEEGAPPFTFDRVLEFLDAHPGLRELNQMYVGKEKYRDLWDVLRSPGERHIEGDS
jgi:spore coat polysaccharide biosynthesis protein SpsF